jgi:hypothetical protein
VDGHHTVEDVGIALGMAIARALGDRSGIRRYGDALVPLDEALVRAVVDVSGRPFLHYAIDIPKWQMLGDYDVFLTPEFFRALVLNAGLTAHLDLVRGDNPHHIVEAAFKAFARALDAATRSIRGYRRPRPGHCDRGGDYGVNNSRASCAPWPRAGTSRSPPTPMPSPGRAVLMPASELRQGSRNLERAALARCARWRPPPGQASASVSSSFEPARLPTRGSTLPGRAPVRDQPRSRGWARVDLVRRARHDARALFGAGPFYRPSTTQRVPAAVLEPEVHEVFPRWSAGQSSAPSSIRKSPARRHRAADAFVRWRP